MKFVALLLLLIPFSSAQAFNYVGHIVISEVAYKMLPDEDRKQLREYAGVLKDEGNLARVYDRFRSVSAFSKAAYIPSRESGDAVGDIFAEYGATLGDALSEHTDQTTSRWHYIDRPYQAQACASSFINDVNIETAFAEVKQAHIDATDDETRALTLVYLAHLVGDAHQPLSTMSINLAQDPNQCLKDRGGMGFCIVEREEGLPCPDGKNLNRFWENSAYAIDDIKRIPNYVRKVQKAARSIEAELSMEVTDWTRETHGHAEFVYSTPRDEWPSRKYESDAEDLAIMQMARAAVRLKQLIESLN